MEVRSPKLVALAAWLLIVAATGWQIFGRMGLDERYRKYESLHAYSPGSPIEDRPWGEEFLK